MKKAVIGVVASVCMLAGIAYTFAQQPSRRESALEREFVVVLPLKLRVDETKIVPVTQEDGKLLAYLLTLEHSNFMLVPKGQMDLPLRGASGLFLPKAQSPKLPDVLGKETPKPNPPAIPQAHQRFSANGVLFSLYER